MDWENTSDQNVSDYANQTPAGKEEKETFTQIIRYLNSRSSKGATIGDGSTTSTSSFPNSKSSPPPRGSTARPASASYAKPTVEKEQLWTEPNAPPPRSSVVVISNIASVQKAPCKSNQTPQNARQQPTTPNSSANKTTSSEKGSTPPIEEKYDVTLQLETRPISQEQVKGNKARKAAISQPKAVSKPYQTPQSARQPSTPSPATSKSIPSQAPASPSTEENYDIILQPETRPISQEQLVAEVKGIYAGLVMVEAKCIEVDNKQAVLFQNQTDPQAQPKLNNEQWQALIALHRTLLHEHHDFFLASQHPSASPALRRLASKYVMPARMWRHGIHSFLELLRHRLPASLDHMLAFIYLAFAMMALLYETVPTFEDTWIECLGDLGRYRMAIEDDDIRDREVWTGVARHWYDKASDKAPTIGRLYHHLAILARPNALQQLFYYSKSLCVASPFVSARESILTLFDPVLDANAQLRLPPLDLSFVKAHGILFTNKHTEQFNETEKDFLDLLDNQIGRVTKKFMEQGYHIAIANVVALTGFGAKNNPLMQIISPSKDSGDATIASQESITTLKLAQGLHNATLKVVLKRIGDPNILPFLHVVFVFIFNIIRHPSAMDLLQEDFPWDLLAMLLNTLMYGYISPASRKYIIFRKDQKRRIKKEEDRIQEARKTKMEGRWQIIEEIQAKIKKIKLEEIKVPASKPEMNRIEAEQFPLPVGYDFRPFPEDFALRGFLWTENYFPTDWFTHKRINEEEKHHERSSMTDERKERILWLGCRIAKVGHWIKYDGTSFKA